MAKYKDTKNCCMGSASVIHSFDKFYSTFTNECLVQRQKQRTHQTTKISTRLFTACWLQTGVNNCKFSPLLVVVEISCSVGSISCLTTGVTDFALAICRAICHCWSMWCCVLCYYWLVMNVGCCNCQQVID